MGDVPGIEWQEDGVGTLPGSDLKFRLNQHGIMELLDEDEQSENETVVVSNGAAETHNGTELQIDEDSNQNMAKSSPVKQIGFEKQQSMDTNIEGNVKVKAEFIEPGTNENDSMDMVTNSSFGKCIVCGKEKTEQSRKGKFCSKKCVGVRLGRTYNRLKRSEKIHQKKRQLITKRRFFDNAGKPIVKKPLSHMKKTTRLPSNTESGNLVGDFCWLPYVLSQKSVTVTPKTFQNVTGKDPFPTMSSSMKNEFCEGMLLEGVDPMNASVISALSVAEVRGFRLRLHFEGYSSSYDFWTNCDSTLIFPCQFCKVNGRQLSPPKDEDPSKFSWLEYAHNQMAQMAPESLFSTIPSHCKFKVGHYLEAFCTSSCNPSRVFISDIIGNQLCVSVNGKSYWLSDSSPAIRPCGWSHENGVDLTPNSEVRGNITETKKAPASCFIRHEDHEFVIGQKLEAVDPRNPSLIRVASVVDTSKTKIKIHFDGWNNMYDFWVSVDSSDIHPAGWCQSTGHPLEAPPNTLSITNNEQGGDCPITGCSGVGHIKGAKYKIHHSEFGCPYSARNIEREPLQDRLSTPRTPRTFKNRSISLDPQPKNVYSQASRRPNNQETNSHSPESIVRRKKCEEMIARSYIPMQRALHRSVFISSGTPFPSKDLPLSWEIHANTLPGVKDTKASDVRTWSINKVAKFVEKLTGNIRIAEIFVESEIDGESFLMLNQATILQLMGIKLGPTLKIYNAILIAKLNDVNV